MNNQTMREVFIAAYAEETQGEPDKVANLWSDKHGAFLNAVMQIGWNLYQAGAQSCQRDAMQVAEAARSAMIDAWGDCPDGREYTAMTSVDPSAIVDSIQSQAQPEPVNQRLLTALKNVTGEIQGLMAESEGIAGLHLNGDIAPWSEIEAGGRFERLSSLPDAEAAIAAAEGQQGEPGLYAIRYRDNWDGEGDICTMLARRKDDGTWISEDTGKLLLQYEGDAILRVWPLHDTVAQPPAVAVSDGWIDKVMTQAKVFASAWSLVGSRFDQGGELENAEEQKRELRAMLAAAPKPPVMTRAATDVLAERQRQVEAEGWTIEHDDQHRNGELATAAACYAEPKGLYNFAWPWDREWWKPKDRRRDLVRAGALILAEIERLDRAGRAALAKAKSEDAP